MKERNLSTTGSGAIEPHEVHVLLGLDENGPCTFTSPSYISTAIRLSDLGLAQISSQFSYPYKRKYVQDGKEVTVETTETGIIVIITDKGRVFVGLEKINGA